MSDSKVTVEVIDTTEEFKFRLIKGTRASGWSTYTGVVYLDDVCAATEYYLPARLALKPISFAEFMAETAIGETK